MKTACVESVNLKTLVSLGIQSSCLFEKAMAHRPTHPTLDVANCEQDPNCLAAERLFIAPLLVKGMLLLLVLYVYFVEGVAARVEPC